jgi:glucose-6-phosphate dehydrogenase assembly protein OpcA
MEDVMTELAPVTKEVALKDVERELSREITLLHGPSEEPIQRARLANLVIFCTSQAQTDTINAQLGDIMRFHPARVILLMADPQGKDEAIKASITIRPIRVSRSDTTFGEQITLVGGGHLVDRLPFAVRSLLIGDLPTNLWWAAPEPPALVGALLFDLAECAEQIMYDSLGWRDPTRGVAATAHWLAQVENVRAGKQWRVVSDLNWRRLKYWRRMLVQSLAPASAPGVADSATEILVEHGPHAVVQAWELASWATLRLGWKVHAGRVQAGAEMSWRFTRPNGDARVRLRRLEAGPAEVRHVRIACRLGDVNGAINLNVESEVRLAVTLEGVDAAARTITVPPHTPSELIGRQLSDRENSPAFRDSMAVAQTMAQSLLH